MTATAGTPGRWVRVPFTSGRVELQMTGGVAGARAARLYRPHRPRSLVATSAGRALARRSLGPPAAPPLDDLDELYDVLGFRPDGVAAIRSSAPGRVVLGLADATALRVVVKIGPSDDAGLTREIRWLGRLEGHRGVFRVPTVVHAGPWRDHLVLATRAVARRRALARVDLHRVVEVCVELAGGEIGPVVHGDLARWNLLPTGGGLLLVDWEETRSGEDPMADLTHYVVMEGAFLGRFPPRAAARLLTSPGSPGWRYLEAVGTDPEGAPALVARHVSASTGWGANPNPAYRHAMLPYLSPDPAR